jgi:hypothetical protein
MVPRYLLLAQSEKAGGVVVEDVGLLLFGKEGRALDRINGNR